MRLTVIGAGTRFMSGISVYTYRLTNALAGSHRVSAILIRQMLPTFLYPGSSRVGSDLARLALDPSVRAFDGVDWYWLPSMIRALTLLMRERPDVVIFQWWTGTVLHSYLLLAAVARLLGADVVVEFHEVQDTGELRLAWARRYVRLVAPLFLRLVTGYAVHSEADRALLGEHFPIEGRPVAVVPHGPHDHYLDLDPEQPAVREAPAGCCNLLFFGVIRPYKGLEDLVRAFNAIPEPEIENFWLTVVGETWEGWKLPTQLIAESPYRERITVVNRYVSDGEVDRYFRGADAVILPYRRSCMSGPLHVAMSYGLPVVATQVGGLVEAVAEYGGAIMIPPADVAALHDAIQQVRTMHGRRFENPHSWDRTQELYTEFFTQHLGAEAADPADGVVA